MAFLARGTPWWILVPPAVAGFAFVAAAVTTGLARWASIVVGLGALALAAMLLNFFRDPEREAGAGIVSAADGVVTEIDEREGRTRVVVFMNPLNVHVNRAPLDARVVRIEHVSGGFIPAFNKESERNERVVWDLETAVGPIRMVQIAGTVARRIVPYVPEGTALAKAQRYGMIRLGSRVDLYLPKDCRVAVRIGQKTTAGVTTIAWPPGEGPA